MRFSFLFILSISLLISCSKKKAEFTIKGTVSDATFSNSLQGALVRLYQIPVGSTDEQLIGTYSTDAQGNYSFSFAREKMEKYLMKIEKNLYFSQEEIVYFSELSLEEDYIRNSSTTAMSWAKLTFVNDNPSPSDHLQFIKQNGKANCAECCPITYQDYYGALDTSIYCINDGNTNYSYLYWVLGTSNQGTQNVFTTAFDTVEVVLNY